MSEQYFTRPNVQPVITNIGTTPEQRQMSTSEFKAKFDEMPEAIQQYIKETLLTELDAFKQEFMTHLAESVSQVVKATRDISLSGDQVIGGFTDIPRFLTVYAFSQNGTFSSIGVVPEVGTQGVMADFSGHYQSVGNRAIALGETSNGWMRGTITINSDKTITITWAKQGTGAEGTVNLILLALYQGGVK